MATVTKPMVLDETHRLTSDQSKNIADVISEGLSNIALGNTSYTKAETDALIDALDYSDTAVSGSYVTEVDETDGVISVTRESADATPTDSSTKMVMSGGVKTALDAKQDTLTAGDGIDITSDVVSVDAEEKTTTSTFNTVNGGLLSSCVVTLEPVQDLHGYSKPWAGGAGKNLLKTTATTQTLNGVKFTVNLDGSITVTIIEQTRIGNAQITIAKGNYGSGSADITTSYTFGNYTMSCGLDSQIPGFAVYYNSAVTNGEFYTRVEPSATFNTLTIYPMVRLSSTTSAWEPYSNICPISGHTTATVENTDGVDTDTYSTALNQTVYGGTVDLVSGAGEVTYGYVDLGSLTWTAVNGNRFVSIGELPNVLIGSSYTTNYGSICEMYEWKAGDKLFNESDNGYSYYVENAVNKLFFKDLSCADAVAFKAKVNGCLLVYALATPTTTQFSKQQIEALIGSNTITAPLTGQSVSASYREVMGYDSVEQAIEIKVSLSSLGTVEDSNLSSQAYSSGDYFVRNGQMCKATTAIAQGATLTEGTNYTAYTLAEILKLIENA